MNSAYHYSETDSKQKPAPGTQFEHKGIKYQYYYGDPAVKDERIIKGMVAEYARFLEELKKYGNDPYFKGQAAGMSLALIKIGVEIL